MLSYGEMLLSPLPGGSVNFGPMCKNHTCCGEVPGLLHCVTGYLGFFLSNPGQFPTLFGPDCGLNCTAYSSCRRGKKLPPSSCAALQMTLTVPALLPPPLDVDGKRFALIPSGRTKGEHL